MSDSYAVSEKRELLLDKVKKFILDNGGIVKKSQLAGLGIDYRRILDFVEKGDILRVKSGYYAVHLSDFTEEELQPVYGGIYVKTFVMFFGEMIRYYITQESDGRVLIKESSRLICNNIYGGADHSRYNLTNEIIISNTLLDDETFCNNVSEYRKKDSLTKQIFTLM